MPRHFLITYVPLRGHKDPDFRELSYGDSGAKGRRLSQFATRGSYLFFHTNIGGCRYLTGYISVKRVLTGVEARLDRSISGDGQSDDWFFLGERALSRQLKKPLAFDMKLFRQLSIGGDLARTDRSEVQIVGSATRQIRELTESDISILLSACKSQEANAKIINSKNVQHYLRFYEHGNDIIPIEDVHKLRESEIQKLLRKKPSAIEPGAKLLHHEKQLPDQDRIDLLLESADGSLIVAELKGPNKLRDEVTTQLASYARDIAREFPGRRVRKMIICDGNVSPKLQKACELFDIEIKVFGVRLECFSMSLD